MKVRKGFSFLPLAVDIAVCVYIYALVLLTCGKYFTATYLSPCRERRRQGYFLLSAWLSPSLPVPMQLPQPVSFAASFICQKHLTGSGRLFLQPDSSPCQEGWPRSEARWAGARIVRGCKVGISPALTPCRNWERGEKRGREHIQPPASPLSPCPFREG